MFKERERVCACERQRVRAKVNNTQRNEEHNSVSNCLEATLFILFVKHSGGISGKKYRKLNENILNI